MRFRVEKLIRDRLPAMMEAQGLRVFVRRLDDQEYAASLRQKLVEEAWEARDAASAPSLCEELADLQEVILALAAVEGLTLEEIEAVRLRKRAERGGFDDRVYNRAVEASPDAPGVGYYLARPEQYPREDE